MYLNDYHLDSIYYNFFTSFFCNIVHTIPKFSVSAILSFSNLYNYSLNSYLPNIIKASLIYLQLKYKYLLLQYSTILSTSSIHTTSVKAYLTLLNLCSGIGS